LLAAFYAGKTPYSGLRVVEHDRDVRPKLAEYRPDDAFRLFKHRRQQVLWFNLLIMIPLGQLNCRLDCFLRA
jgi:hypothetical protein